MNNFKKYIILSLSIVFILVGSFFILEKPIRNMILDNEIKTHALETKKTLTKEKVKENETKDVPFNYEDIQPISLKEVLNAKLSNAKINAIGQVAVPSVGINLPISKGVTNEGMLLGAGTLKENQVLGKGNYTLASHYTPEYDETLLFSPLKRVSVGDEIYVTDLDNIYTYRITSMEVVDQTAVNVLDETTEPTITLITCEDLSAKERRVVKGILSKVENVDENSQLMKDVFSIDSATY